LAVLISGGDVVDVGVGSDGGGGGDCGSGSDIGSGGEGGVATEGREVPKCAATTRNLSFFQTHKKKSCGSFCFR
jgi:hypothetical protein